MPPAQATVSGNRFDAAWDSTDGHGTRPLHPQLLDDRMREVDGSSTGVCLKTTVVDNDFRRLSITGLELITGMAPLHSEWQVIHEEVALLSLHVPATWTSRPRMLCSTTATDMKCLCCASAQPLHLGAGSVNEDAHVFQTTEMSSVSGIAHAYPTPAMCDLALHCCACCRRSASIGAWVTCVHGCGRGQAAGRSWPFLHPGHWPCLRRGRLQHCPHGQLQQLSQCFASRSALLSAHPEASTQRCAS